MCSASREVVEECPVTQGRRIQRLLPAYFMLVSLLLLAKRDFGDAVESPLELSNIHKVLAIGTAILLVSAHFVMRGVPRSWSSVQVAYLGYIGCAVMSSLLFSPWLLYSMWKVTEIFCVLVVSVYLLGIARRDSRSAIDYYELCLDFFRFLLITVAIGVVLFPGDAIGPPVGEETVRALGEPFLPYRVTGVIVEVNPNSIGAMAAVLVFVSLVRIVFVRSRPMHWVWLVISGAFLVFAQSRTAWVGLIGALVVTVLFSRSLSWSKRVFGLVLLGAAAVVLSEIFYLYFTRGLPEDRLVGLTGRALWWEVAIREFLRAEPLRQILGLGYQTASRLSLEAELGWVVTTLHSDYVDALLSTGVAGLLLLVMAVALLGRDLNRIRHRCTSQTFVTELIGVVIILVVRTVANTTIASHNLFLPLFFAVAICAALMSRAEAITSARHPKNQGSQP